MTAYLLALHIATAPYTAGTHIATPSDTPRPVWRVTRTERGLASVWDTPASRTPDGEETAWSDGYRYRRTGLVCAHRRAPKGAYLRVTCQRTGRSVVVRVRDRGPYVAGRIIDLSPGAARAIGLDGPEAVVVRRLEVGR